jgi:DNA-binding transcriptional LysR family regulator
MAQPCAKTAGAVVEARVAADIDGFSAVAVDSRSVIHIHRRTLDALMNDFDPAALDCLAALADEQGFERAAQRLSITQSAVSQRLRSLETQVGQPLVVRSRPLRLTEAGKVLLRFARQLQALRVDVARELGERVAPQSRLAIAVNADSLATWVPPALDALVQRGLREGYGLELVVDDQDFTHDSLRQGAVLGCMSTVAEALQGCRVQALGVMRYVAVASPGFLANQLPEGLHAGNFAALPVRGVQPQGRHAGAMGVAVPSVCVRQLCGALSCRQAKLMCAPCRWAGAWAWRRRCRRGR